MPLFYLIYYATHISLNYKEENLITDIEFKKEDFQPILFTHDVYFKIDEVQSIYKDISNLYVLYDIVCMVFFTYDY